MQGSSENCDSSAERAAALVAKGVARYKAKGDALMVRRVQKAPERDNAALQAKIAPHHQRLVAGYALGHEGSSPLEVGVSVLARALHSAPSGVACNHGKRVRRPLSMKGAANT